MNSMKRFFGTLLTLLVVQSLSAAEWLTDLPTALNKAKAENKVVLIDFTGSDWCVWCKRLKAEVFDKAEFKNYAEANLVLVEADFPNNKPISREQAEANDRLAKRYGIQGYPTVILVDANEKYLGKAGYMPGGPKPFIENLTTITGLKANSAVVAGSKPARPDKFEFPAPAAKINYSEVALKAITGKKEKRLALINNQSFAQGETAMVKLGDQTLKVFCKEIRYTSVIVQIDGKPEVELALGKKATTP